MGNVASESSSDERVSPNGNRRTRTRRGGRGQPSFHSTSDVVTPTPGRDPNPTMIGGDFSSGGPISMTQQGTELGYIGGGGARNRLPIAGPPPTAEETDHARKQIAWSVSSAVGGRKWPENFGGGRRSTGGLARKEISVFTGFLWGMWGASMPSLQHGEDEFVGFFWMKFERSAWFIPGFLYGVYESVFFSLLEHQVEKPPHNSLRTVHY